MMLVNHYGYIVGLQNQLQSLKLIEFKEQNSPQSNVGECSFRGALT